MNYNQKHDDGTKLGNDSKFPSLFLAGYHGNYWSSNAMTDEPSSTLHAFAD